MGSKHISWRRGRRSGSDQIWRDIFPSFLFDLRLYVSSVSVIRCISNDVYLPHIHLFINKKSLPSGLIFIGPEISKVPYLVPVPLFHQKELTISPESLFSGTFRHQCVEMRGLLLGPENTPQSLCFLLT